MRKNMSKIKSIKTGLLMTGAAVLALGLAGCDDVLDAVDNSAGKQPINSTVPYEVWASDQSNSVAGQAARGVNGSFIWVWRSEDVQAQVDGGAAAQPIGCAGGRLATVLRTTNTIDTAPVAAPGGHPYTGAEHSDPHGASVRTRVEDQ